MNNDKPDSNLPLLAGTRPYAGEPGTNLISFPASVRKAIAKADAEFGQDRPDAALATLREAAADLARTNPELCVLMMAAQFGFCTLTTETRETDQRNVREDRRALGVRYARNETTTTTTRVNRKSVSLG